MYLLVTPQQRREGNRDMLEGALRAMQGRAGGGWSSQRGSRLLQRRERLAGLFQGDGKAEHIHKALRGVFGQRLQDDLLHRRREVGVVLT